MANEKASKQLSKQFHFVTKRRFLKGKLRSKGWFANLGCGLALSLSANAVCAQVSLPPEIETQSLKADVFATGTLTPLDGALPAVLWQGSDPETLAFLLDHAPTRAGLPSIGHALRRILMSPAITDTDRSGLAGSTPQNTQRTSLGGKKLLALANAGFIDEARTLASLSDAAQNDPFSGQALAIVDLLEKQNISACGRSAGLASERADHFWVKLRAFCYVISDERDAADLTLSLLRDRGALSVRDDEFLTALVTGVTPNKPLFAKTPLELAIIRRLKMPILPATIDNADGAVVVALVKDETLETTLRLKAARRAVVLGTMSPKQHGDFLSSIPFEPGSLATPIESLLNAPAEPFTDAIIWQSVQLLSAPEFLGQKADLIAKALTATSPISDTESGRIQASVRPDFDQHYAMNRLFAAEIDKLEGALIPPEHAARFALSQMSVGDGDGAARWLLAMRGEGALASLGDQLTREFIQLTNFLALLDPVSGQAVADSAGISISDPRYEYTLETGKPVDIDPDLPAAFTRAVFDAAMGHPADGAGRQHKKFGQAGLAALALSSLEHGGFNPVQEIVKEQGFVIAGLEGISKSLAFEDAWRGSIPKVTRLPQPIRRPAKNGLTPSLKPKRTN